MSNGQEEIARLEAATDAFEQIITTEADSVEVPNIGPTPSLKKRVEDGLDARVPGPNVYMQSSHDEVDERGYPLKSLYENKDGMITYYPAYAVFRKVENSWLPITPINRTVLTLNGTTQYMPIPEIPSGTVVTLRVKPLSGGNTGMPTGCPDLVDSEFQTVTFELTEPLSEIGRNGSSYFHGTPVHLIAEGIFYNFDEGWRGDYNQVLVNYATELGVELVTSGSKGTKSLPSNTNGYYDLVNKEFDTIPPLAGDSQMQYEVSGYKLLNIIGVVGVGNYSGSSNLGYVSADNGRFTADGIYTSILRTNNTALFNRDTNSCTYHSLSFRQADGYGNYIGLTEASWTQETV